ncbi:MAG TPA: hypothetical protein VGO67_12180 [Verrucomicrobiae bacterium]
MALQLHSEPRSANHPRNHRVRSLSEQLDFTPRPPNPLWREYGNSQRFTFSGNGIWASSEQLGHFLITHSA